MLIVADDLTGSHDSAIPFVRAGASTLVLIDGTRAVDVAMTEKYQVLSVNTDSRWMDPKSAYDTVRLAIEHTVRERDAGDPLFKKIDSLLRGNTIREIEAMMDTLDLRYAIVAPTFCEQSRTVEQGILRSETQEFDAIELLAKDAARRVVGLPLDVVRSGVPGVLTHIDKEGSAIFVADAVEHADLQTLLEASDALDEQVLLCGSAGLARQLARGIADGTERTDLPSIYVARPTVVLVGTRTAQSARQIKRASEVMGIPVAQLSVALVADNRSEEAVLEVLGEISLPLRQPTLIAVSSIFESRPSATDEAALAAKLACTFGELAKSLYLSAAPFNLLTTGGDTSLQVCKALGAIGIEPIREIFPGIPLGKLMGGTADGTLVVTKSGGFGDDSAIVDILADLDASAGGSFPPDHNSEIMRDQEELPLHQKTSRPIIGITMGDPSGIGPEITVRALLHERLYEMCRPVVIGDARIISLAARKLHARENIVIRTIEKVEDALFSYGTIDVLHQDTIDPASLRIGEVDATSGEAVYRSVTKVIELAMEGKIDATVTNALNKEALNLAGHHYSGHTELYAQKTGTHRYSMMLAEGNVRVVHVSTHVSLRQACDMVTTERVFQVIRLAHNACVALGIEHPRIAVAGLNPHAGEHGLFGTEEIEQIIPAIEQAKSERMIVEGPLPPDTIFPKARGGLYDIVVAMYHDQGHIPLKVIGFHMDESSGSWNSVNGVNITLGLPIIRTSVDHGTAFDQAWKGTATESSLVSAIDYAVRLALNRKISG